MWRWPIHTRRERVLSAILLVASIAVGGTVIVTLWPASRLGQLFPMPVTQINSVDQGKDPEGMFALSAADRTGFYPGMVRDMTVTLTNPFPFDIEIDHLWASVDSTSSRHCAASPANLRVGLYQGVLPIRLGANAAQDAGSVPVTMPSTVDQACAGVHFAISLHGTAGKA